MGNKTVKHFEISQLLTRGNLEFGIEEISTYDEQLNRVHLTLARSEDVKAERANRANVQGGFLNYKGIWANTKNTVTSNGPENRYLYLGANTDSKKFLLFLMEMYHPGLTDRETEVFSSAAAVSIPTIFQELNAEGEQLVNEYIQERNTENAEKFTEMITMAEVNRNDSRRRLMRLVEAERRLMQ